jgi:hypothetical protein
MIALCIDSVAEDVTMNIICHYWHDFDITWLLAKLLQTKRLEWHHSFNCLFSLGLYNCAHVSYMTDAVKEWFHFSVAAFQIEVSNCVMVPLLFLGETVREPV